MLSLVQSLDDEKCYEVIRGERWPQGVRCPHCNAQHVIKQGKEVMLQEILQAALRAFAVSSSLAQGQA
ncbi:IS1595 family transposase (plasmid) [Deinococcus psychrotolerans]|uniref:IS1595 family transposase n=1 Tax=Deinococcus psychrotolerans TaxID=2489213 RepID=A0A3G8YKQ5_9DEIO|nr:transposase [Deinococcus psychrotolerans]AZI45260.1 IS1595 family transposase [Deinococcus psychrotolerans]